jgi:hypothetical protein
MSISERVDGKKRSDCDGRLRSTRSGTSADRCVIGIPVATSTYNKTHVLPRASADLHVVRRTISTNRNAFALCDKREKEKIFYQKRIPRDCCCWQIRRLESTCSTTSADHCKTGIPVAASTFWVFSFSVICFLL